jgi:hypothetical protein
MIVEELGKCGEVWPCDDDGTVQFLPKVIPRLDLSWTFDHSQF